MSVISQGRFCSFNFGYKLQYSGGIIFMQLFNNISLYLFLPDCISLGSGGRPGPGGNCTKVSAERSLDREALWSLWGANQSSAAGLQMISPRQIYFKTRTNTNRQMDAWKSLKATDMDGICPSSHKEESGTEVQIYTLTRKKTINRGCRLCFERPPYNETIVLGAHFLMGLFLDLFFMFNYPSMSH